MKEKSNNKNRASKRLKNVFVKIDHTYYKYPVQSISIKYNSRYRVMQLFNDIHNNTNVSYMIGDNAIYCCELHLLDQTYSFNPINKINDFILNLNTVDNPFIIKFKRSKFPIYNNMLE